MTDVNAKKRDIAFDYIRVIATLMIAFCHFFQILNSLEIAFWLNVGVQIFLVLSAKLLQNKRFRDIKEVLGFYGSRFLRIMLPVWIYLAVISLALIIINQPPSLEAVLVYAVGGAGFIKSGVLGLGHFWYLSIILIAYLLTPLLSVFADKTKQAKLWCFMAYMVVIFVVIVGVFYCLGNVSYGVHLSLFIVSYYLFHRQEQDWVIKGIKHSLMPTVILVAARIILGAVGIKNWEYYALYDALFIPVCKAFLGYFLFCATYQIFSREKVQVFSKAIICLSNASFEIYITHQFIELAVHEYVPYCNSGTVLGAIIMLIVSTVLIFINTLLLRYCVIFIKKGSARAK